jgi:hypothetical protein
MENIAIIFGLKIKEETKKYSQEQLANLALTTKSYISRGKTNRNRR